MFRFIAALSLVFALLAASPLSAQDDSERQEVDAILAVAKGWGSADMDVDGAGDPMIVGRMDGTRYGIVFYDCSSDKTRCRTMQFKAAWAGTSDSLTIHELHDLNRDNIFGKWYFDNDGDVAVKMPYNLAYGYSQRNLDDTFDWWRVVLKKTEEAF